MKSQELIVLGLASLAVYLIVKSQKGSSGSTTEKRGDIVKEIFDAAGKAFSNGWRYFSDGTAIDPAGNYYFGGQLVWRNPSASLTV